MRLGPPGRQGLRHAALALAFAAAGWGCSSSSKGAGSADAGGATPLPGADDDASAAGDGAGAPVCDASLSLPGDSGAAVCSACQESSCSAELLACEADCNCAAAVTCLQQNDNSYSACPGAISALSNGDTALTNLAGCTAHNCGDSPCFPGSGD